MIILKRILNNKRAGWGKKLLALMGLVHMASKESIEVLEKYYKKPDPKMKEYAKLALEEAKYLANA